MKVNQAGDPDFSVSVTSDRDSNPNNNTDHLSVHVDGPLAGGGGTTTTPTVSPTVGVHKTGNSAANTMNGTATNDWLNGGGGNDLLKGFAGNDTLLGGLGNDRIFGGAGNDHLVGGPGKDVLHGDAGNDTIDARDSQTDTVDCAAGHDTVNADKRDIVSHNCEVVHRK
jgi:Ca2+-binding RTX toxin-like protein